MPPFAELMRMAEVQTKESQSAVQAALEERKRKEEIKMKQQQERERKERELQAKLRQQHFEEEKRERERQQRKDQEKQAIELARQRREEEQRNHLLGKKSSKWPSSSSSAKDDVRRARMPLDDDDGPAALFVAPKRTTHGAGYSRAGRRLPGGAVDVTTASPTSGYEHAAGRSVRERIASLPNGLTKLNVNKRDVRTIDEIIQDRAKAKESKVLDGDNAKGFNDWFGTSKKKDATKSTPGSGANTPSLQDSPVPKPAPAFKASASAVPKPTQKLQSGSIASTSRSSSIDKPMPSKSKLSAPIPKISKSSMSSAHSSSSNSNTRPIPSAKKRPRSPSMSESPPPPKKRATPPGGGGANFRDEIWALFGKSRSSYVEQSVFSDDEDMEADAGDLEREEKFSTRLAKKEDELALQQEKREQEEKERRRLTASVVGMDNPQHYQPLSHALYHQPQQGSSQQPIYATTHGGGGGYHRSGAGTTSHPGGHVTREEEEEEEDDDDVAMAEDALHHSRDRGPQSSPKPKVSPGLRAAQTQSPSQQPSQNEPEKRRPGRPKGSKNRKPRPPNSGANSGPSTLPAAAPPPVTTSSAPASVSAPAPAPASVSHPQPQAPPQPTATTTLQPPQTLQSPSATSAPPAIPEVNAQNQQYYEFQWRVLNLCAEFYGAAEELVRGTPPLVVAQCYQSTTDKVDPLVMLTDAKRICDTLLANPSRLIRNSTPPQLAPVPTIYNPPPPIPPISTGPPTSTNGASTSQPVVTNAQSFVVPLGAQGAYPHSQYAVYSAQYPTLYSYPTYPPGTAYYAPAPGTQSAPGQQQPPMQPQPQPQLQPLQPQPQHALQAPTPSHAPSVSQSVTPSVTPAATTPTATMPSSVPSAMSGPSTSTSSQWSDDEVDKLRRLFEDSRRSSSASSIDWDGIARQMNGGRSLTQIQQKAKALGLKESNRGVKRRRDTEAMDVSSMPPTPRSASTNIIPDLPSTASPAPSHTTITPTASPAIQNRPRPPPQPQIPSKMHSSSTPSHHIPPLPPQRASTTPNSMPAPLPYPMPHVASSSAPLISTSSPTMEEQQRIEQQRMSYYRPQRPGEQKAPGAHHLPPPHQSQHPYLYQPNGNSSRMKDK
ncbi:hypothetical protein ONZ45_g13489 [Pleurotus djamor]|nr:hypothetical protein ONZ45_g13489 [Pleurotus djamor]